MKKILYYLRLYHQEHFDRSVYAGFVLLAIVTITINYWLDFEDSYIDSYWGEPIIWLWMFLFQGLPFLAVACLYHLFGHNRQFLSSRDFWVKFMIGFGILALTRTFIGYEILMDWWPAIDHHFFARCMNRVAKVVIALPAFMLTYWVFEKERPRNWYGLSWRGFDPKPYAWLLLITGACIFIGSFISELSDYYPRYNKAGLELYLRSGETSLPKQFFVMLYELCYGSSFLTVELIFRGFLVMAFTRTLGPHVILPMVLSYAFLHFGKPLTETISSIFGGYILGIIAYYSRNIWGGVFIHVGVAWLMEFFGWLQNTVWK